jgi:hypothetical protein
MSTSAVEHEQKQEREQKLVDTRPYNDTNSRLVGMAIISDKKKHYIGCIGIEGKEPDIVEMEGDKNVRPKWINAVFRHSI